MKKMKSIVSIMLVLTIVFSSMVWSNAISPSDNVIPEDAVEFNGHYYKHYDEGYSWKDAKEKCEKLGGHLITITSKQEDDFAYDLIKNGSKDYYWLGASDEAIDGTWSWLTGEVWKYTGWSGYFDNGYGGKEDYAALLRIDSWGKTGQWNDFTNEGSADSILDFGFICEWGEYSIEFDYENLQEFEHYKAWTYTLSQNSLFNTQLNRKLSYDYIIDETTKAADFFSKAWQATTSDYLTDPSQYYEVVLMDILLQQLNSADYEEKTVDDVKDLTVDLVCEITDTAAKDAYTAYEAAFKSDVGHSSIVWALEDEMKAAGYIYNATAYISDFMVVAETAGELVEYVSKAIKIASAKKELIDYFTRMKSNCTNSLLTKALSEIISLYNTDFSVSAADLIQKKVSEILVDGSIEAIITKIPALGPLAAVWKAGSILSNVACGTEVVAEARLTMSSTKQISDLMKKTSKQYLDEYLFDTGSIKKATMANFSFEILTYIYIYGSDLAEKYYQAVFEGGLININKIVNSFSGKRKATAEDTLEWVRYMSDGLERLKELPNEIRNAYNSRYHGENAERLGIDVSKVKYTIELITGAFVETKNRIEYFIENNSIELPFDVGEYVAPHIRLENWYADSSYLNVFNPALATVSEPMTVFAKYIYDFSIEEIANGEARILSYSNAGSDSSSKNVALTGNSYISSQNSVKALEIPAYYCGYELTTICKNAFSSDALPQYNAIIIYDTVKNIEDGALDNWGADITIICEKDSAAERYAVENNLNYEYVQQEELSFFEKIINAILSFFRSITEFFNNIFN